MSFFGSLFKIVAPIVGGLIGGPFGAAIGGAIGGASGGGGFRGAITGGALGYAGASLFGGGGNAGSLFSSGGGAATDELGQLAANYGGGSLMQTGGVVSGSSLGGMGGAVDLTSMSGLSGLSSGAMNDGSFKSIMDSGGVTAPAGGGGTLPSALPPTSFMQQLSSGNMNAQSIRQLLSGGNLSADMLKTAASGALKFGPPIMQIVAGLQAQNQARSLQEQMKLPDPSQVTSLPGYQTGLDAVQRSLAAQGYQGSGNMIAALHNYGGAFYNDAVRQRILSAQGQAGPAYGGMSSLPLLSSGVMGLAGAFK